MNRLFILISFVLFSAATLASAHGYVFFEFAPDKAERLRTSTVETPYQLFQPQNEYISGFDLWIENPGSAGSASFGLRDSNGTLLTATDVVIPNIPRQYGGKRFHVDFPSQVPVTWSEVYSLKILSSSPSLQLYYAPKIQLLQNNSSYGDDFLWGTARLGEQDQNFTFKFALSETAETKAPVIYNATTTRITATEVDITFNANEPIDSIVEYSQSGGTIQITPRRNEFLPCAFGSNACVITIATEGEKNYSYTIKAFDTWGNVGTYSGTFATPSLGTTITGSAGGESQSIGSITEAQNEPPVLINERVVAISDTAVEISWSTNEATDSDLLIEKGAVDIIKISDATLEFEHTLHSGNTLQPSTTYFATLTSKDSSGAAVTKTLQFTTLSKSQAITQTQTLQTTGTSTPPKPLANQPQSQNYATSTVQLLQPSAGDGVIQIQTTPEEEALATGGYRVDILDENNALVAQLFLPKGTTEFSLEHLPNGTYTAIMYRNRQGIYERVAILTKINIARASLYQRFIYAWWGVLSVIAIGAVVLYLRGRSKHIG